VYIEISGLRHDQHVPVCGEERLGAGHAKAAGVNVDSDATFGWDIPRPGEQM